MVTNTESSLFSVSIKEYLKLGKLSREEVSQGGEEGWSQDKGL
jgi:hypothetical protein